MDRVAGIFYLSYLLSAKARSRGPKAVKRKPCYTGYWVEGFDFPGVESMASGGITVASDIPVHREVYEDAAEYFDPYATMSLVKALKKALYDPDAAQVQAHMRQRGDEVSSRYLPEKILPQWEAFLQRVTASRKQKRF